LINFYKVDIFLIQNEWSLFKHKKKLQTKKKVIFLQICILLFRSEFWFMQKTLFCVWSQCNRERGSLKIQIHCHLRFNNLHIFCPFAQQWTDDNQWLMMPVDFLKQSRHSLTHLLHELVWTNLLIRPRWLQPSSFVSTLISREDYETKCPKITKLVRANLQTGADLKVEIGRKRYYC